MDILDIILAKSLTPQGQINTYASRAQKAVNDSNTVLDNAREAVENIDTITQQTQDNNDLALETLERAEEALSKAEQSSVDAETIAAIDTKAEEAKQAAQEAITDLDIVEETTSAAKIKKTRVRKKGIQSAYETVKNYTATGMNDDGSMTQKAITTELNKLNTKINNLPSGGSGGISNLGAENEGSIVIVDEDGSIKPSSIKEADVILTQIMTGTYYSENDDIVGLEIDYANKTFGRLQAATNLNAGDDFDKFIMYGGRKRCVVDAAGNIVRFLTSEDTAETVANQRIMVYQPAFYYLRVPLSTTKTANGIKINKEHLYLSDKKYAGFMLHPIFRDKNGNALRYILLPAFEGSAYNTSTNTFVYDDAQNIDFNINSLVSIINAKPISGVSQDFTYDNAKKMATNNGEGWNLTNLKFESMNQMLMMVEYGTTNIQSAFNQGLTQGPSVNNINLAFNTGSTLSLLNKSGQAASSTTLRNGATTSYSEAGKCSITYRGMENPFGNAWRIIGDLAVINQEFINEEKKLSFKVASTNGWINAFGYDAENNWVYLPIETATTANSNLPVGDYVYQKNETDVEYMGLMGGFSVSGANSGIFYYGFDIKKEDAPSRHISARVMYIPTSGSATDNNNYALWFNS